MIFIVVCPLIALTVAGVFGVVRHCEERRWRRALDAFACRELARETGTEKRPK